MTTAHLIIADHAVALLGVAAWSAAGATAATRRARPALSLLALAVLVMLIRAVTVAMLAGRGWWFVQEKVTLGLPMLATAGLVAVVIAGPRLLAAARTPGTRIPAGATVALFTAGYAALAGFAVTLVAGYPLSWSTALIALSAVGAGALLTARAVAAPGDASSAGRLASMTPQGLSRRRFVGIAGGLLVATAGASGIGLLFRRAPSVDTGGGPPGSGPAVSMADLRGPVEPAPGGAIRRYMLAAQTATVRLASGREIQAWTYNGQVPGPPITATEGDLIEVTLRNTDIDDGVTVHWHGYDVRCGEDGAPGVTQDVVAPGEEFVYRFRADQVGTYWYHTHHASHLGVRRGLYGTLVVTPRDEAAQTQVDLTVPVHTFDGTVLIADREGLTDHAATVGATVRLRLVNTDSAPHRFALANTPFRVAAVDGRDLNEPGDLSGVGLTLPAGGRRDLVFVMPDSAVALVVDDSHTAGIRLRPDDREAAAVEDTAGWPELDLLSYGAPAAVPFDAGSRPDRHFTMVLDRGMAMVDGSPAYAQTVNGRGHPSIPDQLVVQGDLVRYVVVNRSLETHPWHLHGHAVLVLARNGTRPSGSPLWVDTFDVRPGDVWEVGFRATNPGIWMNHCHNLPHADQGMMLRLRYDGVTTGFHGAHGDSSRAAGDPDHSH